MADDMEPVSPEEMLAIAQHFLLSAPPGQLADVLADVRVMLPAGLLQDQTLAGIYKAFNTDHLVPVAAPDGSHKFLICAAGEVDPTHYIDPKGRQVVGVDHVAQTVVAGDARPLAEGEMDAALEPLRAALETAIDDYVSSRFCRQGGEAAGAVYAKNGSITVCLSGTKVNLRNFYSGTWMSSWTIDGGSGAISGKLTSHVHYFEDGNLQLQGSKDIPASVVDVGSPDGFAAAVVQYITDAEGAVQGAMESMYSNMGDETFRSLRRIMPVTREKFNWNSNAHAMARGLRG